MTNYRQTRVNLVSTILAICFLTLYIYSIIYIVSRVHSFHQPLYGLTLLLTITCVVQSVIQMFFILEFFQCINGKEGIKEVKEYEYINWNLFILVSASTFIVPLYFIITWTTQFIQLLSKHYKEYIDD